MKTEFYEIAVNSGFYGLERSSIFGKKDNVRKYWEDVFIKIEIRPILENLLSRKNSLRIVDLGAGSGEGMELLTHIPPAHPVHSEYPFVLNKNQIESYLGLDISPAMVQQGQKNYADKSFVRFQEADLSEGFPLMQEPPFDVYFSSYCSLSHLTADELEYLASQIFSHAQKGSVMVFDLHGRFSPEWPCYWSCDNSKPLGYNMAYLLPPDQQDPAQIEWFNATYWSPSELTELISRAADVAGKSVTVMSMKDRSILIGRHMDTASFKPVRFKIREQVNRLFDRDYRGNLSGLRINLDFLTDFAPQNPQVVERIQLYHSQWNTVVNLLEALMQVDNSRVRELIETSASDLADELKMLAWLYRNADRFPVVDFWASVMGPQVACILRNLERRLSPGLGCGHSILCLVRIE